MVVVYTIGHSTRPIDDFIGLLHQHKITQLVDIRTVPGSRHNPQYSQQALKETLESVRIRYVYQKSLGGLRPKAKESLNLGWRNQSFRNYADYMQTAEFSKGIHELLSLVQAHTTAIMCAEAVPWRCHRSLVGDALLIRDIPVVDIISDTSSKPHALTTFAQVNGRTITYPEIKNT